MVHIRKKKKNKNDKMMGKWFWNLKGEEGNTYGDEKVFGGLPSWLIGKESACQWVQSLIQEDPTCHTAEAGASQLLSLCYGAQELQLLKPSHYRA